LGLHAKDYLVEMNANVGGKSRALRRLKKISGASRRGSLTFCNNFAVCSFTAKT
jgi:hypothetical protein